ANRVRKNSPVYAPLERFLASLNFPLLGRLSDSEVFVSAGETGVGVCEMEFVASAAERQQFVPIAQWVEKRAGTAEAKAPVMAPYHPAASIPGRAALRVISKQLPA